MKTLTTFFLSLIVSMSIYSQVAEDYVTDIAYLPEIVIKSVNTQVVLDLNAVNIIDYRVFGESILSLKKEKGDFYLGIEHKTKEAENYLLSIKHPRSIYVDCFKNVHILTNEFAYQVYISNKVEVVKEVSLNEFNGVISKCKGELSNELVFEEVNNFNQEYTITLYNKETKEPKVIFTEVDSVMLMSMESIYLNSGKGSYSKWSRSIFGASTADHSQSIQHYSASNISLNPHVGSYSYNRMYDSFNDSRYHDYLNTRMYAPSYSFGNIRNAYSSKVDFFSEMQNSYLESKKIEIKTFTMGDTIVIVDQLNSIVSLYSNAGELLQSNTLSFSNDIDGIIQNPSDGSLYITSKDDQLFKVYKIDITSGKTLFAGGFKNISLTRTRKIYDGWIYYRAFKNGYYKLYRTRLKA